MSIAGDWSRNSRFCASGVRAGSWGSAPRCRWKACCLTNCDDGGGSNELGRIPIFESSLARVVAGAVDPVLFFETKTAARGSAIARVVAAGAAGPAGEFTVSEIQAQPAFADSNSA